MRTWEMSTLLAIELRSGSGLPTTDTLAIRTGTLGNLPRESGWNHAGFISWSGEPSQSVAQAHRGWLPMVVQHVVASIAALDRPCVLYDQVRARHRCAGHGVRADDLHQGAPLRLTLTIFRGDQNRVVYELGDLSACGSDQ